MTKYLLLLLLSFKVFAADCNLIQKDTRHLSHDRFSEYKKRYYLKKRLQKLGVRPLGNRGYFQLLDEAGANIIGMTGPSNKPWLILSAHYDRVSECEKKSQALSEVCNGASDDSAGVALVLDLLKSLKGIDGIGVLLFDKEESGFQGSQFFLNQGTRMQLDDVKLILNFDIIGLNLFEGLESNTFSMGTESSPELNRMLSEHFRSTGLDLTNFSYSLAEQRSDLDSFINKGIKIPMVLFTDGDGSVYHSSADEYHLVNFDKVAKMSDALSSFIRESINREFPYFAPIRMPIYEDAEKLNRIMELGDQGEMYVLRSQLEGILNLGPRQFGQDQTLDFIRILRSYLTHSRNQKFYPSGSKCSK